MGAKMAKCNTIIAVDINEKKFDLAKKLGATLCINPKDEKYKGKKIQDIIIGTFLI
jgi:S-(hydroxymethyl)glutathione dehydrogenase/alcohol dehydrogenase